MSIAPTVDYDGLVEKGAGLVHDGHMAVGDIEIPSRIEDEYSDPGFTVEELRQDVQAYLDKHTPDPEQEEEDGEERPTTAGIDWSALWEEFGFDTPDCLGSYVISTTQLVLALEASDLATGKPHDLIDEVVDEGVLAHVTDDGAKGGTITRGYVLQRRGGT